MSERHGAPPGGEELFRFIVDSAREYAIFAVDAENRVVSWNSGAERFFGYAEDEILGRSGALLFTPEDRERGEPERELAQALANGRAEDERWHLRRDGSRFWMSGMVTPLCDDDGRPRGFVKVARDQTERKRFEDELSRRLREAEEASRLKDEFLATLSHELRTPLTAMLGWSRLLLGGMLDEEGRQRAVETIARNARAQAQIIEDILDVSRIISGKLRLEIDLVDVGAVVRAAVEAVRPAAAGKEIALAVHADPLAGPVRGDADRLQQVVWNLLSNAVKFTPRGGRLELRVEREGPEVAVSVVDTGEGIPADFLPFVFDRFRQADSSTTRRHGGLGIGLAIVRQLVELHGGSVAASSAGRGKGSTFTVTLPVAVTRATDPPFAAGRAAGGAVRDRAPRLAGLAVLVVDDEEDARDLVTVVLESHGAKVTASPSAAEALAAVGRARPDVLLSDIGMPGEDGYELIRCLRALEAERGHPPLPAVALTAYARAEDRARSLAAGFQRHLSKPVDPGELVSTVADLAGVAGRDAAGRERLSGR